MFGIAFITVLALIMISIYVKTRAPKRLAVINAALGLGTLAAVQFFTVGSVSFSTGSVALSAILGLAGTFLNIFLEHFFS